jgi:DNA-binding beta-propeller fold protein YncE
MMLKSRVHGSCKSANRLAALAVAALSLACGQSTSSVPAQSPTYSIPGWTVVAEHAVGRTPGPVTIGGRWAFVPNMSDGTVTQLDRGTGRIIATIVVADPKVLRAQGCAPDSVHAYYSGSWGWRACNTPYAIAWDGSSLWALDNGRKQLIRVDPITRSVIDHINLPGTGWDLGVSGTTAWVSGNDADHSVYVVDLSRHSVIATNSELDQGTAALAAGSGGVWVLCVRGASGHLDRIDPVTKQVVDRYPAEWWSTAVIESGNAVYVRGTYGGDISRINPESGAVEWTQPGPGFIGTNGLDELGATPDGIWLSGPMTARIDPTSGRIVEMIRVSSTSAAAEGNELWLGLLDGSIVELRHK